MYINFNTLIVFKKCVFSDLLKGSKQYLIKKKNGIQGDIKKSVEMYYNWNLALNLYKSITNNTENNMKHKLSNISV